MPNENSESFQRLEPANHQNPFEYIVIVENNDTDNFIHETLVNTLELGTRVDRRKSSDAMIAELSAVKHIADVPDLILLSLQLDNEPGFSFLEKFSALPDIVRAKCKLILITGSNSKEEKLRAIMNPSVIRYLEKPIDFCHFRDFMFM